MFLFEFVVLYVILGHLLYDAQFFSVKIYKVGKCMSSVLDLKCCVVYSSLEPHK